MFLQLTALLWAAVVLGAESDRPGADGSDRGPLVACVACALFILLIASETAPPLGNLVVAVVLLTHSTLVGILWLHDHGQEQRNRAPMRDAIGPRRQGCDIENHGA
jgi:hypothetical protein